MFVPVQLDISNEKRLILLFKICLLNSSVAKRICKTTHHSRRRKEKTGKSVTHFLRIMLCLDFLKKNRSFELGLTIADLIM